MIARHHNLERARGFTLLEVLLAVAVFAIVLVAIHTVFYGAVRLRNKSAASIEAALPLQHTLAIIKRDLANMVAPGGTLSGPLQTSPTTSSLTDQASPDFYTASAVIDETTPWAEVQKVAYLLVDPTNTVAGKDLVRSVTRNLLPTLEEQPAQQWLMSGVEGIAFYFHDGTQWREAWDSTTEEAQLPRAIKVQIHLAADTAAASQRLPIELVVVLDVRSGTNQLAQATQGGGGGR
jgi:general secretion pathway protein J